jgi:SAM-dependent methyltransferase
MAKQDDLDAYEIRYRLVFDSGALHWNSTGPNERLLQLAYALPVPSRCIEFGCGDGYQARLLATLGHAVTGIDISPTAIAKASLRIDIGTSIDFRVGDVTNPKSLGLSERSYDLAIDIGCLHMMVEDMDRSDYLELARTVLKTGGLLFLQGGLALTDVESQSRAEAEELAQERAAQSLPPASPLPRKIVTLWGEKEISLPLLKARMSSLQEYVREIEGHGFNVLSAQRSRGVNCAFEAILVASKVG